MNDTQLLCTFTTVDKLQDTVQEITRNYRLPFNKIYVLENIEDLNQLILTYNVDTAIQKIANTKLSTISVHRKKQTNTIYTINAINRLIESKNNGRLDKSFQVNWSELKNTVLVTAYSNLKIIQTQLVNIINL